MTDILPIPDHDGYMCTTNGNVIGKHGKILKGMIDKNGYHEVSLMKNGQARLHLTHRLILSTFHPIENMNELDVNHRNGNKLDNRLCNLEWVTRSQNVLHSYANGLQKQVTNIHGTFKVLTSDEKDLIIKLHFQGWLDQEIANKIHCSRSLVSRIIRKRKAR